MSAHRLEIVLVGCLLAVALGLGARTVVTLVGDRYYESGEPATAVRPPPAPRGTPADGMYVASTVLDDGSVRVQTWLRAPIRLSELRLTVGSGEQVLPDAEARDVRVLGPDGRVLVSADRIGAATERLRLGIPTASIYLTYTVAGGHESSTTVDGRVLATTLAVDVDYRGAWGTTVVRRVASTGSVLNVACVRPVAGAEASPRPCGQPTADGAWTVDLAGPARRDVLLAQVQLRSGPHEGLTASGGADAAPAR